MGLLKRDLARASAQSLPELGGVFCPLTAPLHLQEQDSSLQQLAKGCTRETLLLHIPPVLYNVAMLLPWQLPDPIYTQPAGHSPAPYLQCYTRPYLSAFPSQNIISLFCKTLARIQTFWVSSCPSKTLQISFT